MAGIGAVTAASIGASRTNGIGGFGLGFWSLVFVLSKSLFSSLDFDFSSIAPTPKPTAYRSEP